jgi:hypothetical protein
LREIYALHVVKLAFEGPIRKPAKPRLGGVRGI